MKFKFALLLSSLFAAPVLVAAEEGINPEVSQGEVQTLPEGTLVGGLGDADANSCVSMRGSITSNGSQWNIDATNDCGRRLQCSVFINLRQSDGRTTSGSCNPAVDPGSRRVCSAQSSSVKWTAIINGNFSCR